MLRNAKKYLFKLNNNQRADYQLKIFKTIFIRIIANEIKKTFSIITITRVISIIETIFILIIRSKQDTIFKKFICYNCDKADHYKKNYIVQNQIEINKKTLKKARLHNLDIDDE